MRGQKWDEATKAQALELLEDGARTFYEVREETGVPVGTLHGWAVAAGFERSDDQTKAASTRRKARLASKREALVERMLDAAADMVERMDLPHVAGFIEGEPQIVPFGGAADCKNYMTAAAIAIDKFRLEMGESTSREERIEGPSKQVAAKLDELAERREKRETA